MAAFREVNEEIRTLFDPTTTTPASGQASPRFQQAIESINTDLPAAAYRAPDFLGWVYQFFNRDGKKLIRDENKGTPRSSYELSVINQFYTPLWVVKVLVDNTLGRLWLQMHPDSSLASKRPPPLPQERPTDLPPVADYLVPRTGEKIRYRRIDDYGNPQPFKRARDIKLLDPACGTLHFGQYAFGLFYQMYWMRSRTQASPAGLRNLHKTTRTSRRPLSRTTSTALILTPPWKSLRCRSSSQRKRPHCSTGFPLPLSAFVARTS